MRDVLGLTLKKAIVHILDNKQRSLVLNDFEIEISQEISFLFKSHIIKSINDEHTRIAKFENETNIVRDNCNYVFGDNDNFVTASQNIAKYLYDSMKNNQIISPANLAVCLYTSKSKDYICILKMDFNQIIQTKTTIVDNKTKVTIEINGFGIPTEKQKLQKCVFIRNNADTNSYDLILLDKQADKSRNKDVADFFINNFLHCKLTNTDKDNTKNFKYLTEKFVKTNYSNDIIKINDAKEYLCSVLKNSDEINVEQFAVAIFGDNETMIEKYKSFISDEIGDFTFSIDKNWVRDNIRRKKIKTDTGIEINIDLTTINDTNKFEIIKKQNTNKYDILIKDVIYTEELSK